MERLEQNLEKRRKGSFFWTELEKIGEMVKMPSLPVKDFCRTCDVEEEYLIKSRIFSQVKVLNYDEWMTFESSDLYRLIRKEVDDDKILNGWAVANYKEIYDDCPDWFMVDREKQSGTGMLTIHYSLWRWLFLCDYVVPGYFEKYHPMTVVERIAISKLLTQKTLPRPYSTVYFSQFLERFRSAYVGGIVRSMTLEDAMKICSKYLSPIWMNMTYYEEPIYYDSDSVNVHTNVAMDPFNKKDFPIVRRNATIDKVKKKDFVEASFVDDNEEILDVLFSSSEVVTSTVVNTYSSEDGSKMVMNVYAVRVEPCKYEIALDNCINMDLGSFWYVFCAKLANMNSKVMSRISRQM